MTLPFMSDNENVFSLFLSPFGDLPKAWRKAFLRDHEVSLTFDPQTTKMLSVFP